VACILEVTFLWPQCSAEKSPDNLDSLHWVPEGSGNSWDKMDEQAQETREKNKCPTRGTGPAMLKSVAVHSGRQTASLWELHSESQGEVT
jgi:hypothetical protein